jgi:hypothetical protein
MKSRKTSGGNKKKSFKGLGHVYGFKGKRGKWTA